MGERIISADSHVRITHEAVKEHLPASMHASYDRAVDKIGGGGVATRPGQNELPAWLDGVRHAIGREGNHDPKARLADMDVDGVDVEVLYCEFSAFRYLYLIEGGWKEATRAFNDTLLAFESADPDRLVVSYQIPLHDLDVAVNEVHRVAAQGGKSLQLPVHPVELGLPDYHDRVYDRLWAAVQETGLPVCLHIGLAPIKVYDDPQPAHAQGVVQPLAAMWTSVQYGNFILSGIFERFPRLKVVFVEPGVGWVPWWLNSVDRKVRDIGYSFPDITELPSFYFNRNVWLTFIDEKFAVHDLRHDIGVENMMWSTDYPHPACTWPDSKAVIEKQFADIPAEERRLMLSGNAEKVWNLQPSGA
ncbi:MAG: hypothetical protein JWO68_1171 [Actinomycetia bacterium]|nr:hypothetical protein [Actinomycetes bacterium]